MKQRIGIITNTHTELVIPSKVLNTQLIIRIFIMKNDRNRRAHIHTRKKKGERHHTHYTNFIGQMRLRDANKASKTLDRFHKISARCMWQIASYKL